MRARPTPTTAALTLALACALGACGDSGSDPVSDAGQADGSGADAGGGGVTEPAAALPIELASSTGCVIDDDCRDDLYCFLGRCGFECRAEDQCDIGESCSDRGRCLTDAADNPYDGFTTLDSEGAQAAFADVVADVQLTLIPEAVQEVRAGEAFIDVVIETSVPVPGGEIAYRVDQGGAEGGGDGQIRRARGETTFVLSIPTGSADPGGDDPGPSAVFVATSVGTFSMDLIPSLPFEGTYAGTVTIPQFGSVGLPIAFQLATDPPGAELDAADAVYLVLPVDDTAIFTPHEAFGDRTHVTRELVFDNFTERWVAVFVHEFRFGADSLFGSLEPGQIRRTLRFELEPFGARSVFGAVSDRWTGFYDDISTDGVADLADVLFEGELFVERAGPAPQLADITPPVFDPDADPQLQPQPSLAGCTDGMFDAVATVGDTEFSCASADVLSASDFTGASPQDQAVCAIAVAESALAGDTTQEQIIAFLDDDIDNPGGLSFAEFMERCAAGTDGTCVPSADVQCGRQLLAFAYARQGASTQHAAQVVSSYQAATREAYLGRQLGAFQTDSQTRLRWLQTTDYPAIVTSAVQDLTAQLLDEWVATVLDVHMEVLAGQFDPAGLAVLGRTPTGEDAQAARRQLLLEMSQSWRGALDALTLGTQRWHALYQGDADRAERAAYVQTRMLELYVLSGILGELSRDAGAGFLNAGQGAGLANLMRELNKLSRPFDDLIFARDGEVVVSTSLDPLETNDTILSELEATAIAEIADASDAVSAIIAEANEDALDAELIRVELNGQVDDLIDELVELCGLPVGCTRADVESDGACAVLTEPGACGFLIERGSGDYLDFDTGAQSVSAAGRSLLAFQEAAIDREIALDELAAHVSRVQLYHETTEAFARNIESWRDRSQDLSDVIAELLADQQIARDASLALTLSALEQQTTLRREGYDAFSDAVDAWDTIRVDGVDVDMEDILSATAMNRTAAWLDFNADTIESTADIVADGLPKITGVSNDTLGPLRASIRIVGFAAAQGARYDRTVLEGQIANTENDLTRRQMMRDATLANLQDEQALAQLYTDNQIADLDAAIAASDALSANAEAALQDLIDGLQAQLAIDLAYERDVQELVDRRVALHDLLIQSTGFELRLSQAELTIAQRVNEYLQVAQRAQLLEARLVDLERQVANVNSLLGSPAVVFAWANRLAQAESRLERAKSYLMEWLVALEYFAVRPFMDTRLQILLARNTYQLEEIAADMRRIQSSCGGAINRQTSEVSLRGDLMALDFASVDSAGTTYDAAERFLAVLERAAIPIDRRTRYTADSTVGDLVDRTDILAASFTLSLDDFANLEATCNAKIASVSIQLVGDDLGAGQPTVALLYDGSSQLRSCQPDLDAYVAQFGPAATTFGQVTSLRTAGRSIAPVAGINEFPPEASANATLAGLPLASQYTVLIDPELGENARIAWSNLTDIMLRIEYVYQDPFPAGQCE